MRASNRVQATRFAAIMVNASHAVLIPNSPGGEPAQAGVLGVPDAVLDSRVRPVTGFEEASWPVLVLVTKAW